MISPVSIVRCLHLISDRKIIVAKHIERENPYGRSRGIAAPSLLMPVYMRAFFFYQNRILMALPLRHPGVFMRCKLNKSEGLSGCVSDIAEYCMKEQATKEPAGLAVKEPPLFSEMFSVIHAVAKSQTIKTRFSRVDAQLFRNRSKRNSSLVSMASHQ